ncbi:uncharacterized protein LOC117649077 isoform X1 [Thrips palmi]|uniref:Uncharacterized protein LOC117649077 isoform X1 n=1 Tax=Thrips palmi TaxID=161013 RepID=A0A6P8ZDC4_THRPL|nr:uncharacterized protein LOC117649077 isoform X1 [Thrips palmi]
MISLLFLFLYQRCVSLWESIRISFIEASALNQSSLAWVDQPKCSCYFVHVVESGGCNCPSATHRSLHTLLRSTSDPEEDKSSTKIRLSVAEEHSEGLEGKKIV